MSETCGLYSPDIEVWSGFVDEHVTYWAEFAAFKVTNDAGTTNCKQNNYLLITFVVKKVH